MQEQELFSSYEVKAWDFSPRFYKILAASAVFNLLALGVFGQFNLITKKGCDSPLVSKVCTVIDALYVGGTVLTTDSRTVDEPYTPTEITSEDEIVWVPVDDKFAYPEGYFQPTNTDQALLDVNGGMPTGFESVNPTNPTLGGNPTNPTLGNPTVRNPLDKPPVLPKPSKRKSQDDFDSIDLEAGLKENPTDPKNPANRDRVVKDPTTNPTVADNKVPKTKDPTAPIEYNKRPLKELVPKVKEKLALGMKLDAPFLVQANGKLNDDGKIEKIRFTKSEGTDPNLLEIVRTSVAAINDSGYLQHLSDLSGRNLDFLFSQDAANISAVIQSEAETKTRASSLSILIGTALKFGLSTKEKQIAELKDRLAKEPENAELQKQFADDSDDLELLKRAEVTTDGKKLIIRFLMPQDVAKAMIERKLNAPETPEIKKPNSAAQVVSKPVNSAKR